MKKMTQAEFARHLGITRQAVNKMVKAKRIPTDGDGKILVDEASGALAVR